jgi:hypothetical protein
MMSKNKQISPPVSPKNRLAPTYCRYIIATKRWTLMLLRLYLDYLAQKNPPCISGVGSTPGKDQLLIGDVSILVFETIITVPGLLGINVA